MSGGAESDSDRTHSIFFVFEFALRESMAFCGCVSESLPVDVVLLVAFSSVTLPAAADDDAAADAVATRAAKSAARSGPCRVTG